MSNLFLYPDCKEYCSNTLKACGAPRSFIQNIKALQFGNFVLHFTPMQKAIIISLVAAVLGLSPLSTQASEYSKLGDPPSALSRYSNAAQEVILKGLQLVGINYRLGGESEKSGLDCSSFVRLVFKETIGVLLPRTAREMSEVGQQVNNTGLQPGDLVFFNTMRRAFSHVGIYIGDGYFLHAPRPGSEVRVESMQSGYWLQRYNGARRVLQK